MLEAKKNFKYDCHASFSNHSHIRIVCKDVYLNLKNHRFGTFRARSNRYFFMNSTQKTGTRHRHETQTRPKTRRMYDTRSNLFFFFQTIALRDADDTLRDTSSSGGSSLVTNTLGHSGETFTQSDRSVTGLSLRTYRFEESVEEDAIMIVGDREPNFMPIILLPYLQIAYIGESRETILHFSLKYSLTYIYCKFQVFTRRCNLQISLPQLLQ